MTSHSRNGPPVVPWELFTRAVKLLNETGVTYELIAASLHMRYTPFHRMITRKMYQTPERIWLLTLALRDRIEYPPQHIKKLTTDQDKQIRLVYNEMALLLDGEKYYRELYQSRRESSKSKIYFKRLYQLEEERIMAMKQFVSNEKTRRKKIGKNPH